MLGRAWLPGDLVALGVITTGKKVLAQQAVDVTVLLKGESNQEVRAESWWLSTAHCRPVRQVRVPAAAPPGACYLLQLIGAVLLRLWACWAAPAHMDTAGLAAAVGLMVGGVAGQPSQRHHGVLAGGGQEGTAREGQVSRVLCQDKRAGVSPAQGGPTALRHLRISWE